LIVILATVVASGCLLINTFHGDPTIYLIYARNIANGDLFSFNPGEFSSGSTSPLWALILSIGFIESDGILVAKLIGLILTLIALMLSYKTLLLASKSSLGAVIGTALTSKYLTLPGLMLYESPLIVLLMFLLILNSHYLFDGKQLTKRLVGLYIIWSLIPVSRPDASAIVVMNAAALAYHFYRRGERGLMAVILVMLPVAFLPAVMYYGYSFAKLGVLSVSAYGRSFALKESAPSLLGIFYSFGPLKFFLASQMTIFLIPAVWGAWRWLDQDRRNPCALLAVLTVAFYFILLSLISPVARDVGRYILPALPFFCVLTAIGVREVWVLSCRHQRSSVMLPLFVGLSLVPVVSVTNASWTESKRGLTFDVITERRIVEMINARAEKDATILIYEVQDRYYLRPDLKVLSLDGVTDGKVVPYLRDKDLSGFLMRYKPRYWLANDAVEYRPSLSSSILKKVVEESRGKTNSRIQMGKIVFTKVADRAEPLIAGFAAFRELYKLDYEQ